MGMQERIRSLLLDGETSLKDLCRRTGFEKKKVKKVLRKVGAVKVKRDGVTRYHLVKRKGFTLRISLARIKNFFEVNNFVKVK